MLNNRNTRKKSQNLVELVLILPLLLVILLGILEYALFQRNVATVQDIALEAAVVASKKYVDENTGPFAGAYAAGENTAIDDALTLTTARINALGLSTITFNHNDLGPAFGTRPFALYEFYSTKTVTYKGDATTPLITLTIDYRNPVGDGVSTQLIYHYNLILFGVEFRIPGVNGGRPITIIPKNIQISSTQTREYIYY